MSLPVLLLLPFRLPAGVAEAGLHGLAHGIEQRLGVGGERSLRLQLEILLDALGRLGRRNHLAVLVNRRLAEQVHAFLVVGFGLVGIGGDGLVEGGVGLIHLAVVGQHRAQRVVVLRGAGRIDLRGGVVLGNGLIGFAGIRQRLAVVVVIAAEPLAGARRGIGAAERDHLLERFGRAGVDGVARSRIGRFLGGVKLISAERAPQQVAVGIGLRGLLHERDRLVEVARFLRGFGAGQQVVQVADLGVLLLHGFLLRLLFRRHLGLRILLLLRGQLVEFEVDHVLFRIQARVVPVEELLAVFVERDLVLARLNAEREELAFLVGLERVLLSALHVDGLNYAVGDGLALTVERHALQRGGELRPHRRGTERQRQQYDQCGMSFHAILPAAEAGVARPRKLLPRSIPAQRRQLALRSRVCAYGMGSAAPAAANAR